MPQTPSALDTVEVATALRAAAALLRHSRHAVALVGAGLSAESGIPTYRGSGGVWTKFGEPTIDGDLAVAVLCRKRNDSFPVSTIWQ